MIKRENRITAAFANERIGSDRGDICVGRHTGGRKRRAPLLSAQGVLPVFMPAGMSMLLSAIMSAALLAGSFVLPAFAAAGEAGASSASSYHKAVYKEISEIPYADRDTAELEVSLEDFQAALKNLSDALEGGASAKEVESYFHELELFSDKQQTFAAMTEIAYYCDMDNEELADRVTELTQSNIEISDLFYLEMQKLLKTDAGKEKLQPLFSGRVLEIIEGYHAADKQTYRLSEEEEKLTQEYNDLSVEQPIDFEERAGAIYMKLLENRNAQAIHDGYENYAEDCYDMYDRDYTAKDIQRVYQSVRETAVPLRERLIQELYGQDDVNEAFDYTVSGEEEIWDTVEGVVSQIDETLAESMRHMRKLHLYDNAFSDDKMDVGFTSPLPYYGDAYIFNSPYGYYQDIMDMMHEFGHYNGFMQNEVSSLLSLSVLDVEEIKSQGLELLSLGYADELYGEYAKTLSMVQLYNILSAVIDGCLFDEFQYEIYTHPGMTLQEINALYASISEEYGDPLSEDEQMEWVYNSHTFQSPMYYISYATSGLSAIDIFTMAAKDRDKATQTYLKVASLPCDTLYQDALEECGLHNIFVPGVVETILDEETLFQALDNVGNGGQRIGEDKESEPKEEKPQDGASESAKEGESGKEKAKQEEVAGSGQTATGEADAFAPYREFLQAFTLQRVLVGFALGVGVFYLISFLVFLIGKMATRGSGAGKGVMPYVIDKGISAAAARTAVFEKTPKAEKKQTEEESRDDTEKEAVSAQEAGGTGTEQAGEVPPEAAAEGVRQEKEDTAEAQEAETDKEA